MTFARAHPVILRSPTEGGSRRGLIRAHLPFTMLVLFCTAAGVALVLLGDRGIALLAVALVALLTMAIWHRPRISSLLLVTGAALFESYNLGFSDSLTDRMPFFRNIADSGLPLPVPVTFVEILFILVLFTIAFQRASRRQRPLRGGPLLAPMVAYVVAVFMGLMYGIGTGGDLDTALWEIRAQVYLFLAYLIAVNTIDDRKQLITLTWLLVAAISFKAMIGIWRFAVTLHGNLDTLTQIANTNSLMAHEESYFFSTFLMMAVILYLFRAHRSQLIAMLALSPLVIFTFLANERRAGMLTLGLGLMIIAVLAYSILPSRRRLIARVAVMVILVLPPYVLIMGNSSGFIGQPARAVMSQINPTNRDESSDAYRAIENQNLKYNIADDPILGKGYGKPIKMYIKLPDISALSQFWNVIPHNTVLWVWMRTGFVGFVVFWFLVGSSVVRAALLVRHSADPYFKSVAALTVVSVVGWVALGTVDQGLADFRSTILIGTLLGAMALLGRESSTQGMSEPDESLHQQRETKVTPPGPVVLGPLKSR